VDGRAETREENISRVFCVLRVALELGQNLFSERISVHVESKIVHAELTKTWCGSSSSSSSGSGSSGSGGSSSSSSDDDDNGGDSSQSSSNRKQKQKQKQKQQQQQQHATSRALHWRQLERNGK
jgi:hypothetical protein